MLPFTTEQFLDVFGRYNQAIWPLQVVTYALGLVAVGLALRPVGPSDRTISLILAAFWLWTGLVYHLVYFREINGAAVLFGALFVVQGALWLLVGVVRPRLAFRAHGDLGGLVGGSSSPTRWWATRCWAWRWGRASRACPPSASPLARW